AYGSSGFQYRLATTGDYQPSLRFPWLAAVVIRDEAFQPLPTGEAGLVTVRTSARFDGYWFDREKTRQTLRDDWVVMGDIGYFDEAGYLHVLGRQADRVRKGDQWINPRGVEELIHHHPAVKEACLVQNGERTALAVSLRQHWRNRDREKTTQELTAFLASRLPAESQPDKVTLMDELPRSFLNKILRREIRAPLNHVSAGEMSTAD
ncbi:MAG: hypothetical protein ABW068_17945, partial [Candidatus Thiodiazotropha sp.]